MRGEARREGRGEKGIDGEGTGGDWWGGERRGMEGKGCETLEATVWVCERQGVDTVVLEKKLSGGMEVDTTGVVCWWSQTLRQR